MIDILFDTETFGAINLSNVKYWFSIYIKYRYGAPGVVEKINRFGQTERQTKQGLYASPSGSIIIMAHAIVIVLNPLPNNKIMDVTKLKAFADGTLNVARMMIE